jgi:hypothetical protein
MMTRTERDKMLADDLYDAGAPELQADAAAAHEWLARYNAAFGTPISERRELLLERLAAVGEGALIRPRLQHQSRCRRVPELQLRYPSSLSDWSLADRGMERRFGHCATRAGPSCSLPGQACPNAREASFLHADRQATEKKRPQVEKILLPSAARLKNEERLSSSEQRTGK